MPTKSAKKQPAIFRQLCELIPPHLVSKLGRKYKTASRGITQWSHLVSLLYAQFTHSLSLNDVCDSLRAHRALLSSIRGAKAPSRNGLSYANKTRNPKIAEELFWTMLTYFDQLCPGFGGVHFRKMPRRFKRSVLVMDSTTIKLIASCIDWAKHRRRKAAAKVHMLLNLETFLPAFAIVDSAKGHDNTKAHELCAKLKSGEIVVFDMAYIDYSHLFTLTKRGVFWVSRVKESMKLRCVKRLIKKPEGKILRDDIVLVQNTEKRKIYPRRLRRVIALVEIDGKETEMVFFTNNLEWAATSICDLYKSRWSIETFFKQVKQTLKINSFLGYSRKAIEWQIWTALLMYLLLRYLHFCCDWNHSFTRLFTCLRAVLWQRRRLMDYLNSYGTAHGSFRRLWAQQQALLPGFG
jgi:hypothetical protein